jgi:hypothetical protein
MKFEREKINPNKKNEEKTYFIFKLYFNSLQRLCKLLIL